MATRYGEMLDLIACFSIYHNGLKEKPYRGPMSFDEALQLR